MNNDQPIKAQIKEMMRFINNHKKVYVFGTNMESQKLMEFLQMSDCPFGGGIRPDEMFCDEVNIDVKIYDKQKLKELAAEGGSGVLLAGANKYINDNLQSILNSGIGINDIYVLNEFNKSRIAYKLTPRCRENFGIEVNLADHCNMNCQMCDHFSQFAEPHFLSLESFTHDMERLSDLFKKKLRLITLLGGEPLLNGNLPDFIVTARRLFPDTNIVLFTNGILLKSWENKEDKRKVNLWKLCHENEVTIRMTLYPNMVKAVDDIMKLGEKYCVKVDLLTSVGDRSYMGIKKSTHHPFDFEGKADKYGFICCYQFNEVYVLREGRIYLCPIAAYADIFNNYFNKNLIRSTEDSIDIYKANSWQEITAFASRRIPFCDYCRVMDRKVVDWAQSNRSIDEYS